MGNVTEGSLMRIKNAIFLNKIVEEIIDYDKKSYKRLHNRLILYLLLIILYVV